MKNILLIEDEKSLRQGLVLNLSAEGYQVTECGSAEEAEAVLNAASDQTKISETIDATSESSYPKVRFGFDLYIFDVMLPQKSGADFLLERRKQKDYTPALLLTAKGRNQDILEGFESGADDYVTKPFDLHIFLARVSGLIRRTEWATKKFKELSSPSLTESTRENPVAAYACNGRNIDFSTNRIIYNGNSIAFTVMEAQILRYLIENSGRIISRGELLEKVWNMRADTETRAIDNFVVRIRRALGDDSAKPHYLKTVRGVGYLFEASKE